MSPERVEDPSDSSRGTHRHADTPPAPDHPAIQPSLDWKAIAKRTVVVVVAGLVLYLVAPGLAGVFASWPQLATLQPLWLLLALGAEVAHFGCTFALQRLALRTKEWFPVVTAQLAGNAISLIVPGGAAAGAAVQFRMLAGVGMDAGEAIGGLTAFSLLGIGGLLALPVLVLPVILFGAPVNSSLAAATLVSTAAFVLFAASGAAILATDEPLTWAGQAIERARNRIRRRRRRTMLHGLPDRLIEQRDLVRSVLGAKWWQAVLLSAGRLGLDMLCLLFSLYAVGADPRPALVLLAFAVAGIIGLVPLTPGGLGTVEASLSAILVLAGVPAGQALLATLTYRLASYWLPLLSGPVAYGLFRRHLRVTPTE